MEQQPVQPISHPKSLMEVTADQIRNAIISGELPLGSKLSEQRLADTLGVSRSPVRDALAVLQSEGLVRISPKRGTFVFTPDLRHVDELCEYRTVLEAAGLRMGMARNYDRLVAQLTQVVTLMQGALETSDAQGYSVGDTKFHQVIVNNCGNRSMIKAYSHTISPVIALRTHLFIIMEEDASRSLQEHKSVLEACRAGDADLAVACLEVNIGNLTAAFRVKQSQEDEAKQAAG